MTCVGPRIAPLLLISATLFAQGPDTKMFGVKSLSTVSAKDLAQKTPGAARRELNQGLRALRKGRNDQAVSHLAEAARLDPASVEVLADLAVAYALTGELSRALDHFEKALALDPEREVLYEDKANILILLDRFGEAEPVAREALRRAPYSINANYALGMSLIKRGLVTPEAVACIKLAAANDARAQPVWEWVQSYLKSR